MNVLDVLNEPWAILAEKKRQIDAIYEAHSRGEKVDIAALEAKLGRPLNNEPKAYDVVEGVAVLPIEGVIAKKISGLAKISGGTSTALLSDELDKALADPAVNAILLSIDSPGGTVAGTPELASKIFAARGKKPIYALADGTMASAAYWLGAAADKIFITGETTAVGSIGVIATHVDTSKAQEKAGIKTTEVVAGDGKNILSENQPLSDEGRALLEDRVGKFYSMFSGDVAKFRGVPQAAVKDIGAKVFIGSEAIKAGLVDGVSTIDDLVAQLAGRKSPAFTNVGAGAASESTTTKENNMSEITLKIDASEVAAQVDAKVSELRKEFEAKATELRAEGASAERDRIKSILGLSVKGHEKLVMERAFDGTSTKADVALAIVEAEQKAGKAFLAGLEADGAAARVTPSGEPEAPKADAKEEPKGDAVTDESLKKAWDADAKLRGEFAGDFGAFKAFKEAEAAGNVRILSKKN